MHFPETPHALVVLLAFSLLKIFMTGFKLAESLQSTVSEIFHSFLLQPM